MLAAIKFLHTIKVVLVERKVEAVALVAKLKPLNRKKRKSIRKTIMRKLILS
jgi:hypothetical protein